MDQDAPRTRLEQVLRQRHWTLEKFRDYYRKTSGTVVSERQAYRWVAGELRTRPYPQTIATLEELFGEPAERLFGPPYGHESSSIVPGGPRQDGVDRGSARYDWEGQLIAMSADRARNFLTQAEASDIGPGTIDQLADDVRRLAIKSQEQPFPLILRELVETQERAFDLLESRHKPDQARDLYLLTGLVSGFMAKASHDLGSPHDALTHTRAAYACADNAGHDGLRAWIRGLQALITYWSGRFDDSVRYARLGEEAAARSRGTAAVWLVSSEARALGALNRWDEVRATLGRASEMRDSVSLDELDQLGSICSFSRPTQLYYAADAFAWGGEAEAGDAERLAVEALTALDAAPVADRGGFGNEQGARCDLAVARLLRREQDGAIEALQPVLDLPVKQRQQGIVRSVERVRGTVLVLPASQHDASTRQLTDAIETFMSQRLALPPGDPRPGEVPYP